MLENQRKTQKIRRQITGEGLGHEVNVYVPLGLVKPKIAPRRQHDGSLSAEQGMQQYHLTEKEVERRYEHEEFLQQVIEGQNKKLAIIGEPGAGKSTWLEQIAFHVDQSEDSFPICIPLGNLGEKTLEDYLLQNWLKEAVNFFPNPSRSSLPPLQRGVSNLESGVSSEPIELEELFRRVSLNLPVGERQRV
ncbi:MAG TPA: hypothetical protein DCE56_10025 [Cyanobacteria bacterium UBA8553]|nr:hypothetical protein [Cyanobacteria bacterium UBA8553]HAJ61591.1 hypothetical protein [Cyanobacteria bacterium UBA8543]